MPSASLPVAAILPLEVIVIGALTVVTLMPIAAVPVVVMFPVEEMVIAPATDPAMMPVHRRLPW